MYDLKHTLFTIISFVALTIALIICKIYIKDQKKKDIVLKVAIILTLIIHYSPLYVDFFATGRAEIHHSMILSVYPCNLAMWLLLYVAFAKNKQSKIFKTLAIITFYLGSLGGIIGIVFNLNYAYNPNLLDWHILNGLLSHVTLMFGCIYILVGGYIKIRVSNIFAMLIGEAIMIVNGYSIIFLFDIFNVPPVNCMFLLYPPIESAPWLNAYLIGLFSTIILFVFTVIYEQIAVKRGERWYNKLKEWNTQRKNIKNQNNNMETKN